VAVDFYARWGRLEPHRQNGRVALRNGMPSRMILRDLDSTILDPVRIRPYGERGGWRPERAAHADFATGGRRLAH
jgi:siderophore synthetase component